MSDALASQWFNAPFGLEISVRANQWLRQRGNYTNGHILLPPKSPAQASLPSMSYGTASKEVGELSNISSEFPHDLALFSLEAAVAADICQRIAFLIEATIKMFEVVPIGNDSKLIDTNFYKDADGFYKPTREYVSSILDLSQPFPTTRGSGWSLSFDIFEVQFSSPATFWNRIRVWKEKLFSTDIVFKTLTVIISAGAIGAAIWVQQADATDKWIENHARDLRTQMQKERTSGSVSTVQGCLKSTGYFQGNVRHLESPETLRAGLAFIQDTALPPGTTIFSDQFQGELSRVCAEKMREMRHRPI